MKVNLIEQIIKKIEKEIKSLKDASKATRKYSQSDDLKSEGKYDTRAIEAKYLAEAQEARVKVISHELETIKKLNLTKSKIATVGSLIFCSQSTYFVLPIAGQGTFYVDDQKIITISHKTNIADEVIGLEVGDSFEHPVSGKELHITKIL